MTDEERNRMAARLAAWLNEWRLDHMLRATMEGPELLSAPPLTSRRSRPTAIRVRDLVLLHPSATPSCDRPLHVAVLGRRRGGLRWVAPFSRFSTPASNGEWRTGRSAMPLRVLALWNARWIPPRTFANGWVVGRFTERERRAAREVWEAWRHGRPPPSRLRDDVGPPVVHPDDPRRLYEEEEARIMDEAAAGDESKLFCLSEEPFPYGIPDAERLKAAEEEEPDAPRP